MKRSTRGLFVVAVMSWLSISAQPARPFPHPDRIRYDSQCLTIEGKDVLIYSGAFHYFRCPKPLWADRFQKIKEAGFNTVETYAPWNWHEQRMPANLKDRSKLDLTDLEDWLSMAERFGFYVIVRPGPYICAEWDTGGFPQWLLTRKPADWDGEWLRSDEPAFLAWSKHWYDAVCPVIARHQITRKAPGQPGVILVQLENEYDYAKFPDQVKIRHLKALAETALAKGIEVPLFTCWTRQIRGQTDPVRRQVFDACNFYPRWNVENELRPAISRLRAQQPDAPLMTAELQGGWFSEVGGKLSEDQDGTTAAQIQNISLFALQMGDTLLNYYMLFGGSNLGDWAARNLTTTYDYNAPIREWGGAGERYQRVKALGRMLRDHGAKLARAQAIPCDVTTTHSEVSAALRRAPDGSRYIFVRTSEHKQSRAGTAHLKTKAGDPFELEFAYDLEPFGAVVLYLPPGVNDATRGEWLPKAEPVPPRPLGLPAPVVITFERRRDEPGPSHWTRLPPGQRLSTAGVYDSRFLFYRARASVAAATNLLVDVPGGDSVLVTANGALAPRVGGTSGATVFALKPGANDLRLLYENLGHANGGTTMENPCGIAYARLFVKPPMTGECIGGWRMRLVDGTHDRPEVTPDFSDDQWSPVAVDKLDASELKPGQIAVYRTAIEFSAAELEHGNIHLNFGRIDDQGWVYVNGTRIGEAKDWSRAYSFDATRQLHPGRNVVAVIVHNVDGAGGLGQPTISQELPGATVAQFSLGHPAGIEGRWWEPALDDKLWEKLDLGASSPAPPSNALLTWHRLRFVLRPPEPGVWVPWRVRLHATGNGFVYLNGHPLGRYWQAGPQRDFYLPECWLNFGDAQSNVLTLSLRPVDKDAAIQSAVIEPYADCAEARQP
jgi:hypothetical protein